MSVVVFTALKIPQSLPKASTPQAADIHKVVDGSFPFLEYATNNVLYHANAAEAGGVPQEHFLASFPVPQWVRLNNLFETRVHRH
jgi:hypothetical protein